MKLEITKEKVLEAAAKCGQAKETLKTLFPEAFEAALYKKGDRFRHKDGEEYMICFWSSDGDKACLFSTKDGNYWSFPVCLSAGSSAITKKEFAQMTNNKAHFFTKL